MELLFRIGGAAPHDLSQIPPNWAVPRGNSTQGIPVMVRAVPTLAAQQVSVILRSGVRVTYKTR